MKALLKEMEVEKPLDSNEFLLSFGPSFGPEALDEFFRRLQELGLEYIDDFFIFTGDFPDWCEFWADMANNPST